MSNEGARPLFLSRAWAAPKVYVCISSLSLARIYFWREQTWPGDYARRKIGAQEIALQIKTALQRKARSKSAFLKR
jgi:hypothetical protein